MESSYLEDGSHISFGLDITELKNRENALNQLQTAIDALQFGLCFGIKMKH